MKAMLTFLPALVAKNLFEKWTSPPMAIFLLSGVLKKAGHDVDVIDTSEFLEFSGKKDIIQHSIDYIAAEAKDANLLCFSSNTFNWGITRIAIESLKNIYPDKKIIIGGLHPSIFDEYIMKTTSVDYIIRGEGEIALPLLIETLKNKGDLSVIDGLTYKETSGAIRRNKDQESLAIETLETCTPPDYSFVSDNNTYIDTPVESSRGCPFSCIFCSIPHRHNWRGLKSEVVLERVESAIKSGKFKSNRILFVDDCFTINIDRALEIINSLYDKYGYKYEYFFEVRVSDIVRGDLLQKISPSIVSSMQIGVETGYDEGLKKINKKMTIKQLFMALDIIYSRGFTNRCFLSFIIGFPWETEEDINKTLNTVERILRKYDVAISLNWLIMLPSDLWKQRDKYGIQQTESIFDNPYYSIDNDVFMKVHPNLTWDIIERVEDRIQKMIETSSKLRFGFYGSRKSNILK